MTTFATFWVTEAAAKWQICAMVNRFLLLLLFLGLSSSLADAASKVKSTPVEEKDDQAPWGFIRLKVITVCDKGIIGTVWIRKGERFALLEEPVALYGDFPSIVDGDTWQGSVYLCGRYQYTGTDGALKTVRAFTTSYIDALRRTDPAAAAIEDSNIKPPFGLHWGEGAGHTERLLNGAKAKITKRTKIKNNETWQVEGFVQSGLKATFFGFTDSKLIEVALVYVLEEWTSAKYKELYSRVKARLEQRYASATSEFEGNQPATDPWDEPGSIKMQESIWQKHQTVVRIAYYEIPHGSDKSMAIKVIYQTGLPELKPTETTNSPKP